MIVCVFIYCFRLNLISSLIIWLFGTLSSLVHASMVVLHHFKIINPLQGSIDRTVKEMIKNDMVKDVKELEMFGSRLNERKVSLFRHKNNDSLWTRAFKTVHVENMKYLLSIDPDIDVNEQDSETRRTPMIYAAIQSNINAMKLLLNQPQIDVNHRDNDGCSALFYAVANEHLQMSQLLVDAGADINIHCYSSGETPLIMATKTRNKLMMKHLIESNVTEANMNHCDNNGYSALFYAVSNKRVTTVQLLIESGADINDVSRETGQTTLMTALLLNQNYKIASWLLQNGAKHGLDTSIKDKSGKTAWVYCWKTKDWDVIDMYTHYQYATKRNWDIKENGIKSDILWDIMKKQNVPLMKHLCKHRKEYGLDTSIKDGKGQTPWVHCWKTKNCDLMVEYINYHKNNKTDDWNTQELDCNKKYNALTWNFPNVLEAAELELQQQTTLFKSLINAFLDRADADGSNMIVWPIANIADFCMLTWLWNQLKCLKSESISHIRYFKIALEAIARLLHNIDHRQNNIDFVVINEINQLGWTYFFQPFNSGRCFTYFVESIVNPKNPIKIDDINQINNNGETVLIVFAKQRVTDANRESMQKKCDQVIFWLNHEYSISRGSVVKFINIKDKKCNVTAIVHGTYSKNYHFVRSILKIFAIGHNMDIQLIHDETLAAHMYKFNSAWITIIESKRVDLIRLAVAAMVSIREDDTRLNIINRETVDQGIVGITPLFWALNNQFYELLRLMLSTENVNLNPTIADHSGNTIWEYVAGLTNGQQAIDDNCRIDRIDIETLKLSIDKDEINVNRYGLRGNQA